MFRRIFVHIPMIALFPFAAAADPSQVEFDATRTKCRDAFLAQDAESYMDAASSMIAFGALQNLEWAKEVDLCLAYAKVIEGADLETARARAIEKGDQSTTPADSTLGGQVPQGGSPEEVTKLSDYLKRVLEGGSDIDAVVHEIASDATFSPDPSPDRDALEAALKAFVQPIPATQPERNLAGYQALARVNDQNQTYKEKVAHYEQAIETERKQLEEAAQQLKSRLVRKTSEFDGSSWARHPSSPRYQDIRNYVTLYLLESGSGQQTLELFFNYTSRRSWLFVESASINIDGVTESVPVGQWFRDNDTEIWEFASMRGPEAVALAKRIAEAERAVVRFNGQQFYDDYVISDTDKRIMREMLAMWDALPNK